MNKLLTSLALGVTLTSAASATVLLSESFNYPNDTTSLAGANDGIVAPTGLTPSGTWTPTYQTGSGLTFNTTGLSTSLISGTGGAANVTNSTALGGTGSGRTFDPSVVGTANGTVYWGRILFSFGAGLPGESIADPTIGIGNTQGDAIRLFSNAGNNGIGFEMFQSGGSAFTRATIGNGGSSTTSRDNGTAIEFSDSAVQLAVFKITFSDAGNDQIDLWLNPISLASEVALGASQSVVSTTAVLHTTGSIVFRRDNNSSTPWVADEFVLGNSFADIAIASAVPEPSSFAALAGLGVLGFVASRRRRQA
jgi:hypothetical protein